MKLRSSGKKQTLALLAVLAMGTWGGVVSAKDYTTPITGNITVDTEYEDIYFSYNKYLISRYTFTEDSSITVDNNQSQEFTGSLSKQSFKVTTAMTTLRDNTKKTLATNVRTTGDKLSMQVTAGEDAIGAGILLTSSRHLTLTPGSETEIKVIGAEGNSQKSYGIWRAVTDNTQKVLTINNELHEPSHLSITIDNINGGYGIADSRPENMTLTDTQKESFYNGTSNKTSIGIGNKNIMNVDIHVSENVNASTVLDESAGIYVNTNRKLNSPTNPAITPTIKIVGTANLDVEGHGILLTPVEESSHQNSVIEVTKGGKITVHPDEDGAERYAIYAAKGEVSYGYNPARDVMSQVDGDVYIGDSASVSLGFYGSDAYFNGTIKDTDSVGAANIILAGGAVWNNVASNTVNTGINTKLTLLEGSDGILHQTKDSGEVNIDQLNSLLFNIAYDHDTTDPTKILGGDVKITAAKENAIINVFTDYDDNMSTEAVRENVLNALAQKIYYTNYATTEERNLTGQVSIAEGLTAASATKYFADMSFSETTGQGYLSKDTEIKTPTESTEQTVTEFTDYMTYGTNRVTSYVDAGVYSDDTFTFTKDSKITLDNTVPDADAGEWMTASTKSGIYCGALMPTLNVDLQDHKLDISVKTEYTTTGISAIGATATVEINNPGAISINAVSTGNNQTAALFANSGGQIFIHNGGENQEQKILTVRGSTNYSHNGAVIKTMNGSAGVRSWIKIDGLIDLEADSIANIGMGEGISAVASTIDVGGGRIIVPQRASNYDKTTRKFENEGANIGGRATIAIRAYSEYNSSNIAYANVNVIKNEDSATGEAIAAGNNPVQIEGDVATIGSMGSTGKVSIGLNTEDSYWKGDYVCGANWDYTPDDTGFLKLFMGNKAKWTGSSKYPTTLVMDSGAEWTGYSTTTDDSANSGAVEATIKNGAVWHNYNDSENETVLKSLTGGDSSSSAGYIDMTEAAQDTTIQNYAGYMNVLYAHDEEDPTNISGANITIDSAAEGSDITLLTDNTGFDVHDEDKTVGVIGSLAKKLIYKGAIPGEEDGAVAENNLSGHVGIAEGLTSSSAVIKLGDMTFSSEDGTGSYEVGTLHTPSADIIYGDNETAMMKGSKSAMAALALLWRAETNDLVKRMGDLRMGQSDTGIWAKYYGGKNTFDSQNTDISVRYNAVQVGFDKQVNNDWKLGFAISHNTGDANIGNGDADLKSTGFGIYGTRMAKNGTYLDIIVKAARLSNEYDVFNAYGHKLNGDYDVWGTSASVEFGKRFKYENGLTVDPNIEFTFGHIAGKSYDAKSDYGSGKSMHVDQDGFNSFIGRLGVRVGKTTQRASYYAKLALAHEFCGGFDTTFSAENEPTGKTHLDFDGTWLEVQLGVTAKLSDRSNFYADVEKTFGGDLKESWRLDAGFRLSF